MTSKFPRNPIVSIHSETAMVQALNDESEKRRTIMAALVLLGGRATARELLDKANEIWGTEEVDEVAARYRRH